MPACKLARWLRHSMILLNQWKSKLPVHCLHLDQLSDVWIIEKEALLVLTPGKDVIQRAAMMIIRMICRLKYSKMVDCYCSLFKVIEGKHTKNTIVWEIQHGLCFVKLKLTFYQCLNNLIFKNNLWKQFADILLMKMSVSLQHNWGTGLVTLQSNDLSPQKDQKYV